MEDSRIGVHGWGVARPYCWGDVDAESHSHGGFTRTSILFIRSHGIHGAPFIWQCEASRHLRQQHYDALQTRQVSWPACLSFCGIMPICLHSTPEERERIASTVQRTQAAILEAREARRKKEEVVIPKTDDYPWGWDPAGPRERPAEHINVDIAARWNYGVHVFHGIIAHLKQLEWPMAAAASSSSTSEASSSAKRTCPSHSSTFRGFIIIIYRLKWS